MILSQIENYQMKKGRFMKYLKIGISKNQETTRFYLVVDNNMELILKDLQQKINKNYYNEILKINIITEILEAK